MFKIRSASEEIAILSQITLNLLKLDVERFLFSDTSSIAIKKAIITTNKGIVNNLLKNQKGS